MANENYPPIRRVITGHDMNNVAKAMSDAPATKHQKPERRDRFDLDVGNRFRADNDPGRR